MFLQVKNLKKSYGEGSNRLEVLKGIDFSVEKGNICVLLGPSGCGKSSLLSILCGLEKKSNGNIIFPNPHKSKIGYMLQQDSLFPWLTIFENCLIGLKIEKKLTKENIKKVKDLLKTYGLKDFMNSYPKSLSGGMRQRVG